MQLRMLEMRWRETGAPEDEAAYLEERLRKKQLTKKQLELAALLGNGGARVVLGADAPEPVEDPLFDIMGAKRLPWDDPEFAMRAVLAPARLLVGAWEEKWPDSKRASKSLREAVDLCRSKDAEHAKKRLRQTEAWKAEKHQPGPGEVKRHELQVALIEALELACRIVLEEKPSPWQAIQRAFWVLGKATVTNTLRAELSGWALGYSDPLNG